MYTSCPICQVGQPRPRLTNFLGVVNGTLLHAPNVPAWVCDVCGEVFYEPTAMRRMELLVGLGGPAAHPAGESAGKSAQAATDAAVSDAPGDNPPLSSGK